MVCHNVILHPLTPNRHKCALIVEIYFPPYLHFFKLAKAE